MKDGRETVCHGAHSVGISLGMVVNIIFGVEHALSLSDSHGYGEKIASRRTRDGRWVNIVMLAP